MDPGVRRDDGDGWRDIFESTTAKKSAEITDTYSAKLIRLTFQFPWLIQET